MVYTEQECIEAVKEAAEKLGESPSERQYQKLDIRPHKATIIRKIGSWDKAKERAGLEKISAIDRQKHEVHEKPDHVKLPDNVDWKEDLNSRQRWYYKNKEKEKRNARKRGRRIRGWYKQVKKEKKCIECGESRPKALEFHHVNPATKKESIYDMVHNKCSIDNIKEEMDKCIVLCANCHRVRHANR